MSNFINRKLGSCVVFNSLYWIVSEMVCNLFIACVTIKITLLNKIYFFNNLYFDLLPCIHAAKLLPWLLSPCLNQSVSLK